MNTPERSGATPPDFSLLVTTPGGLPYAWRGVEAYAVDGWGNRVREILADTAPDTPEAACALICFADAQRRRREFDPVALEMLDEAEKIFNQQPDEPQKYLGLGCVALARAQILDDREYHNPEHDLRDYRVNSHLSNAERYLEHAGPVQAQLRALIMSHNIEATMLTRGGEYVEAIFASQKALEHEMQLQSMGHANVSGRAVALRSWGTAEILVASEDNSTPSYICDEIERLQTAAYLFDEIKSPYEFARTLLHLNDAYRRLAVAIGSYNNGALLDSREQFDGEEPVSRLRRAGEIFQQLHAPELADVQQELKTYGHEPLA